jgi:hypothetical protein
METHMKHHEGPNNVPTHILHKHVWNDLKRIYNSAEWACLDACHYLSMCMQANRDGHLSHSATRNKCQVEHDISRNRHCIGKVTVDLVQDVFGWSAKEDGACFWGCAFGQEGEVSERGIEW